MNALLRASLAVGVTLILSATSAWAQATASISGTARDESGAVLPGVTITVTQTETGLTRTTASNETGSYSLPNLPLGPYKVEATLQGFRTSTQTIVLQVNSAPVINPTLAVGDVAENIQVTGVAPLVDTRTSGVSTVVESQRIVELPLNARQVTQLISLSGLAVQTTASPGYTMNTGVRISVAGGSEFGVSYSLDGAVHINNLDGSGMPLPFPDALQEFRLVTGTQEAAGGLRAGASVNAVTRSGTNVVHGSAFEFLRDSRFNAPDFFSNLKDNLKRNQFGGTIGGPLAKDRLFYFVGYQGTTTRQNPNGSIAFVPTAAMLAGDFTAFASPACNGGRQVALRTPFVDNRVDPSFLSPAAVAIAKKVPQPLDACGRVLWGEPRHQNEHQVPVRVDFQASQKQSFFARYLLTTDYRTVPYEAAGGNILATATPGTDDRAQNFTAGHTYVINSGTINSFRVVANDVTINKPGANFFSPQDVGINAYTYVPGFTTFRVISAFNVGAGNFTSNIYGGKIQNYGASDDLTIVKGSHQFGVGGHFLWSKSNTVSNAFSIGTYNFTGAFTGLSMSDFLVGRVGQHRQASENPLIVDQHFAGAYVQDTWKINRMTLNYGVIWEPFFAMVFPEGDVYNFDREKFLAGTRSTVMKNAPPGFSYPGDPGFNGKAGVNSHFNSWDPRVGLAWDLTGDGRTSVRVGAGLAHDYIKQDLHENTSSVSPFRLTVALPGGVSLDNPWATFPGGNPFPYKYDPNNPAFPAYGSYIPLPADLKPTKQYSWNAAFQRQITPQWFASATYVGTRIVNQITAEEQNPALFVPGNCNAGQYGLTAPGACSTAANLNQRRLLNLANPNVALGYVTQYSDKGYQSYHGMLLNSRLDLGRYVNVNGNYTLSKCEGVPLPAGGGLLNIGWNLQHQLYQNNGPNDISLDEGPCIPDRRHIFNLTGVVHTPDFANKVVGAIASDWTVSSVIQMRTGAPVNVVTGIDNALNGFFDQNGTPTQRPNLSAAVDPYGDKDSLTNFFNIAAFSQPATGTLGDTPYNYLRGPGFFEWDQAFTRGFGIGTGRRIELRAEGINLTNRFNRGNPGSTLSNPATFGRITTLAVGATPRIWQFAVKYSF